MSIALLVSILSLVTSLASLAYAARAYLRVRASSARMMGDRSC